MDRFSIKDIENLSGIKAHTLRIWEKRYQIITPKRTDTNIRYYTDDDLRKLLNVSFLNRNGYKISKIAEFNEEEINKLLQSFLVKNDYELFIDAMLMAAVKFDAQGFEKAFFACEERMGFVNTMLHVVYPLLTKMGVLWGIQEINPAHEHFISNLIRMKLFHAIEQQKETDCSKKTYLLFLHQNESHDIGLLLAYYLLRSEAYPVIYLGANVPLKSLEETCSIVRPDVLYTLFTGALPFEDLRNLLTDLAEMGERIQVRYTMPLERVSIPQLADNIREIDTIDAFLNEMRS